MMSKRIWLFCLSATFLFCHAYEIPCCNIISAQFMKQKTYILSILEYFNYISSHIIRLGLYLTVSVITITKIDSISRFTVTIIFFFSHKLMFPNTIIKYYMCLSYIVHARFQFISIYTYISKGNTTTTVAYTTDERITRGNPGSCRSSKKVRQLKKKKNIFRQWL